jgi:predicted GNAT superfamily acetyltransferase
MTLIFRAAERGDLPAIVALNDAAIPHVNALPERVWHGFLAGDARVRVASDRQGAIAALTVVLPPGRAYGSENYAWFQRKLADFAYVDRIVVGEGLRGRGVGRAAYADIFAAVGPAGPPVVCEVNLRPANDTSLAFHGSLGFRELAVQNVYGASKRVVMLGRRPDGAAEPSLPGPDDAARLRRADAAERAAFAGPGLDEAPDIGVVAIDASGLVVGRVVLLAGRDGIGDLSGLFVAPDRRGRGLGARLVAAARREAKLRGWRGLELRPAAIDAATARFLARNGFEPRGPRHALDLG